MVDPDFQAGQRGDIAPPNGDWTKYHMGRNAADDGGGAGAGCFLLLMAFLGLGTAIFNFPVVLGVAASAVVLKVTAARMGQPTTWRRLALGLGLAFTAGLATLVGGGMGSIVLHAAAPEATPMLRDHSELVLRLIDGEAQDFSTNSSFSPPGATIERQQPSALATILLCIILPAASFFGVLWTRRPVRAPVSRSWQLAVVGIATGVFVGVTLLVTTLVGFTLWAFLRWA